MQTRVGINSLRNTFCSRTRQLQQLTTPTHLARARARPPLPPSLVSLSRRDTPSSRCPGGARSIKLSRDPCHLLACFTRLSSASTMLPDPPPTIFPIKRQEADQVQKPMGARSRARSSTWPKGRDAIAIGKGKSRGFEKYLREIPASLPALFVLSSL